jgi:tricorn protease
MAWNSVWSPDGSRIAFVDDRARIRIVDVASGRITTADVDGNTNSPRRHGPVWSPDSKWLAYCEVVPEQPAPDRRVARRARRPASESRTRSPMRVRPPGTATAATSGSSPAPTWRWPGWANTSSMQAADLRRLRHGAARRRPDAVPARERRGGRRDPPHAAGHASVPCASTSTASSAASSRCPCRCAATRRLLAGPAGTVFIGEQVPNTPGAGAPQVHARGREAEVFARGVVARLRRPRRQEAAVSVAAATGRWWRRGRPPTRTRPADGRAARAHRSRNGVAADLRGVVALPADFFYDPDTHGNDWDAVRRRYEPLSARAPPRRPELRARHGERRAVGRPQLRAAAATCRRRDGAGRSARCRPGGADGGWRIARIYTFESWNPGLTAPLDRPGLRSRGHYILAWTASS